MRKASLRSWAFLALILSFYGMSLNAQDTPSPATILKGLTWRNIGPNRGGRSLAIAGTSKRKKEYYFGAVGGGLWKTIDGGFTWKPVTDGQIASSSVGAVAVSESNPDIVYIGMGETELRGNIMQGDGIYKSVDGGKTWKNIGLKNTQAISRIRIHPTNPDIVYVSALGHPFGPNEERGVFKTTDGGTTWKKVLYKSDSAGAEDLALDPTNPDVIYAGIWQVYRTPYKMWGGGGACGLYKSMDAGNTWTELTKNPGMPKGPIGKIGVTISPVNPNRVWAIVEANDGGLFRSDDAGASWTLVNNERKLRQRAFYYSRIVADPQDSNAIYALNVNFYKSTDGGHTFPKAIRLPHGDNHDLWIDPSDTMRVAEADDGGGTISTDGGASWTDEDFPTAQLYHIIATNDFPYEVAGAQQDNSTIAVPSEGWGHMAASQNSIKPGLGYAYDVGGGESGYIAQDPDHPDIFYAGSQGALLTRFDRATGQVRDVQVYPRFFSGEEAKVLPERWQWTYPIVFSPVDHKRLYTCSQHVWVTVNEGQSWDRISPDLTYNDSTTLGVSGGVITRDMNGPEIYGTVFALAPSWQDVNTLWAGSDDGLVHVTRDNGKSWQNITPPDMLKNTRVSIIEASHFNPAVAYVAAKRYQMDDRAPYIWKTNDYGKTWKKIITGIRSDDYVHAIREDIIRPGLLYAGTEHGIYVSFNDGDNWEPLKLNLPDVQVSDIAVTEKDLVIGTHGRSIYVLGNVAPVREYQAGLADSALHLYQPFSAVRHVQNAVFQYYLKDSTTDLKVEILDGTGKLVKSFTGMTHLPAADSLADAQEDEEYGYHLRPAAPAIKNGLNTFTWDLRYPAPAIFKGMILWGASPIHGPLAPPGTYQVRFTAGGEVQTKSFEIKLDPRLKGVTPADVQQQFQLAMEIWEATNRANQVVISIRRLKSTIAEGGHVTPALKALVDGLSRIEENLYQVKNQSGQDPLNYPIKLNNRLAALERSVETGDARPTAGSYQVFKELSAELEQQMVALKALLQNTVYKNTLINPLK
ncbi:MAG TPA: hypothetical protein VNV35_01225 [Puia sp.]|nr:hypothetical protein [Puia sp.]